MSLQIECSVEKSVTFRAVKRSEDCTFVVYVAYVIFVSQQLHSVFVWLHTSSSRFSDNITTHNVYIRQQIVESQQIFNNRNVVRVDFLELIGAQSIHFLDEQIDGYWGFFLQSLSAMEKENKRTKQS